MELSIISTFSLDLVGRDARWRAAVQRALKLKKAGRLHFGATSILVAEQRRLAAGSKFYQGPVRPPTKDTTP